MFAEIAPCYDRMNRLMTLACDRHWRAVSVGELGLRPGQRAIDVCTGTGDFLFPLSKAVGSSGLVVGLDFCRPMLEQGRRKGAPGELCIADACALPIVSDSADAATIGFGLRNVTDLPGALAELFRILRPGGRLACLDMSQPRGSIGKAIGSALDKVLPKLGHLYGSRDAYAYLPESAKRFASREGLATAMSEAGFIDICSRDFAVGHVCLHFATKPS